MPDVITREGDELHHKDCRITGRLREVNIPVTDDFVVHRALDSYHCIMSNSSFLYYPSREVDYR